MKSGLIPVALALAAYAQDMRTVVELAIPTARTTIAAKLTTLISDESHLDTKRIQQAMDSWAPAKAVVLSADATHNAFITGPLDLRKGVTLVVAKGATLFSSRNPRDYALQPNVCGTITEKGHVCRAVINGDNVPDAAVMGDGAIDGRGSEKMFGQNISWWDLAEQARKGGNQNNPRLMILGHCNNFTLYRITLKNSPNFHVSHSNGNGFTVWGVKVWSPATDARNTDGIDPGNSTVIHSFIHTDGGAIRVINLSIDGGDDGIRIKSDSSRGGLVHDVIYEDVCIRNTKNPIFMDTNYSFTGTAHDLLLVLEDITLRNVRIEGAGKVTRWLRSDS
jgi:polygalacturonase